MTRAFNVLLVEDDNFKRAQVVEEIERFPANVILRMAASLSSARAEVQKPTEFLILDMSLPSYDVGLREPGGQAQGFAGQRLLHFMKDFGIEVPTVVLTQFEVLNEGSQQLNLAGLRSTLSEHFPELVKGVIYYSSSSDDWRHELQRIARAVHSGGHP